MLPKTSPAPHILVVDDDERLRALLHKYLGEQGFFVSTAANTAEADEVLRVFSVDGVVLDVMMPGETGIAYATRLRAREGAPPVLLLTARGEADDRIAGLEAGAADYLGKPFAPKELLLRLENIVARARAQQFAKRAVRFGDYRFDMAQGRLNYHDQPIYLTSSEVDCLRILAESAGSPVSRETMATTLGDVTNERSVDVQINRLRKKIEPQPGKPIYLQTIRHAGYVLYAEFA
jgi:two-component system, OmpR family, phosphate regulon response regulator OmpR